ncbi:leucine-rich repeat protein, partial [Synechococcus sp. AH-551-A21]
GNQLRNLNIPDSVTSIGVGAFAQNQLTSVEIGDSVISIKRNAFYGNQLRNLDIPYSVTSIGDQAFADNQITSVDIPDSVTSIGFNAFQDNQITSVDIPDSVTSIGINAFKGNQLTSVVIPDSVTSIGSGAFDDNPIETITISKNARFDTNVLPEGVEIIISDANQVPRDLGISATSFDENIAAGSVAASFNTTDPDEDDTFSYSLVDGVGANDNALFTVDGNQIKVNASPDYETQDSYSIRLQTEDSGGLTFEKEFIFSVNDLNEDPTNLLVSASTFKDNIAAASTVATLSSTDEDPADTFTYSLVSGIGDTDNSAFTIFRDQLLINESPDYETQDSYSVRLKTTDSGGLTFEKTFTLSVNDLEEKVLTQLTKALAQALVVEQGSNIIIPNTYIEIEKFAFYNFQLIADLTIPDSIKQIPEGAFRHNLIQNLDLGNSVTSIGWGAFEDNLLTTISIPEGVTSISPYAFQQNQLTNVELPDSIQIIGEGAFNNNPLESISISEDATFDLSIFPSGVEIIRRSGNTSPTDLITSASSFNENIAAASAVATLSSTDPDDGDTFTYALISGTGGTDNSAFTIVGDKLKIKSSPDYETKDSYSVRLSTTDSGDLTFEKSFTFKVNDLIEYLDSDSDGFVDGASNYKLFNSGTAIDLTNKKGKKYSDASTSSWDAIKSIKTDSGFQVLLDGAASKE